MKRMCHIYTQHTIIHSFTIKQYDKILNTENVLTAMVQNYQFSDTHHKFPLICLNVQITYTNTVHFNGNFKHCYHCLFFKG